MPERNPEAKRKITLEELRLEANNDAVQYLICIFMVFENQRAKFLAEHPNWPYTDELEALLRNPEKDAAQNQRLMTLMTTEMGIAFDNLEIEALKTYATLKNFEVVWN